eukprot:scaffold140270_cov18-Tisochrysis_lutea.AAC.1
MPWRAEPLHCCYQTANVHDAPQQRGCKPVACKVRWGWSGPTCMNHWNSKCAGATRVIHWPAKCVGAGVAHCLESIELQGVPKLILTG